MTQEWAGFLGGIASTLAYTKREGNTLSAYAAFGIPATRRELGATLVAFERFVERQLERVREREHQRSRGPGMGRWQSPWQPGLPRASFFYVGIRSTLS